MNYSKSKTGNLLLTPSFKQNKNSISNNKNVSIKINNHNNKNQINKESSKGDSKESDDSRFLDERGLYISGDGSIYDNDGNFFNNEDGLDEHGGKYNKFGEYINGSNFNENIGMYDDEIKNSLFNENELKKEVEEKQKIEFEKIKNEAIKSKKLLKNYYRPYEKNNSSSSDEDSYDEEELINEALKNEENEKIEYYNELMDKEKLKSNDLKQISQIINELFLSYQNKNK